MDGLGIVLDRVLLNPPNLRRNTPPETPGNKESHSSSKPQ